MTPAEILAAGAGLLVVHHHILYPALAERLGRRPQPAPEALADADLPSITIVMPAHNEAALIGTKIANLAALDYPTDRVRVVVACDGCTDSTERIAIAGLARHPALRSELLRWDANIGKIATLNRAMAAADGDITVFTDVSALLPSDALRKLAAWFADGRVGAVGAGYRLGGSATAGESAYWSYQSAIKAGESRLGALIGAHGACYAIRTSLWAALPGDTINDDFVIPMAIAQGGWRTLYDPSIAVLEGERTRSGQDSARRRRLGAGNLQQLIRHGGALHPRRPGLAFAFLSGKALRTVMPLVLVALLTASLSAAADSALFAALAALQLAAYAAAAVGALWPAAPTPLAQAHYAVAGYLQSAAGSLAYLFRRSGTSGPRAEMATSYAGPLARATKRTTDIVLAALALVALAPLFPLIALAIKLDSPGPVFFRQLRVGRVLPDRTELFMMIKFRSMRQDAEAMTGAVWAQKQDPRITRVGNVLRKTRLDELPQLLNVLAGDMSIVGPRPERPGFYKKLEDAIPFYAERTWGLRPGITGLAQVCQGYDETIEDVRTKVMYDHAYAASIAGALDCLRSDLSIALRTVGVMVLGRGR